jgi:hypothetical protein
MNNIPGFNAEESLYTTKRKYFTSGAFGKAGGNVHPAQISSWALADWALPLRPLCCGSETICIGYPGHRQICYCLLVDCRTL